MPEPGAAWNVTVEQVIVMAYLGLIERHLRLRFRGQSRDDEPQHVHAGAAGVGDHEPAFDLLGLPGARKMHVEIPHRQTKIPTISAIF